MIAAGAKRALKPASSDRAFVSSFRDPAGRLVCVDGRIFRFVNPQGLSALKDFLSTETAHRFQEAARLVSSRALTAEDTESLRGRIPAQMAGIDAEWGILEHSKIDFPCFPYEWPPEMLHAAGVLTLDLAQAALKEGMGLKDASPYNVLFEAPNPVFVDLLSFEKRNPRDFTWLAYGQFVRTFLLPLALNKFCGSPLDRLFLAKRDGIEPGEVCRQLTLAQKLRFPFRTLATLPTWLAGKSSGNGTPARQRLARSEEQGRFILQALLRRARRLLDRLKPVPNQVSKWSSYESSNRYSPAGAQVKEAFVSEALREFRPKRVLDVGANRGRYSELAARQGSAVVAIDSDRVVMGELWRRARSQGLNILPLVVNLARPSPAMGWRNRESSSFLERAREHFDAVLMLAVVHHLLVTDGIPLAEILEASTELTRDLLIIEFVPPDDPMFRQLAYGREELHTRLDQELFETACRKHYFIVRSLQIEGSNRRLYLMRKR
ncbi:MAG: class I SAM-dependent methyltransferase [Acidobacteria bacterium]|nr:class I SAM-dependent methyltransferase [Acidobacteriota bacterium]MCI0718655.1 class I SAM-dependent methyltransferase [Acidobacteriota bacterium]